MKQYNKALNNANKFLSKYGGKYSKEISFDEKWSSFKNSEIKRCLISDQFLIKVKPGKITSGYKSYYKERKKQLEETAYLLLQSQKFKVQVLDLALDFGLDERTFLYHQPKWVRLGEGKFVDPELLGTLWFSYLIGGSDKWFQDNLQKIKLGLKNNPFLDISLCFSKYSNSLENDHPLIVFARRVEEIAASNNLSELWHDPIIYLLLTGRFFLPAKLFSLNLSQINNNYYPCIVVYPETKLADIQQGWAKVEELKYQIFNTKKKRTKLSRIPLNDLPVEDWYKSGIKDGTIKVRLHRIKKKIKGEGIFQTKIPERTKLKQGTWESSTVEYL